MDASWRWRVADVLDAKVTATGGVMMLVSWLNGDAASWEPLRGGTSWARERAHHIVAARKAARRVARGAVAAVVARARADERVRCPQRATPRVAGDSPIPGLGGEPRRRQDGAAGSGEARRRVEARQRAAAAEAASAAPVAGQRRTGAQAGVATVEARHEEASSGGHRRAR